MKIIKAKTEDGLYFSGQLFSSGSKNIIIHIHGMSGDIYSNSFYPSMQQYYPENGWDFLVVENRGTHSVTQFNTDDGIRNLGNAYEIFEDCVLDIKCWVEKAEEMGYEKIWLQSHSLGASKVVYYLTQVKNSPVEGLVWLSPSDMLGLVHDDEGQIDHDICMKEAVKLTSEGKDSALLSHDLWGSMRLSAKTYINFFSENSNTAIFNYANDSLGWEKVEAIKLPVIAFTGTKDDGIIPVMDAYKAMDTLEEHLINSLGFKTVVYENAEHDFEGFGEEIAREVMSFVRN
jgi:pimeloyl-ACP methyl ester carboxylesterase